MASRTALSFCRICTGQCGMVLTVDDNDRITDIRPDREDTRTLGYGCSKGLEAIDAHYGPQRLLRPLKKQPDGSFAEIGLEQALDEIAARMKTIIEQHGVEAIAGYRGSGGTFNSAAAIMLNDWLQSVGSPKLFSSFTIDQSAKVVVLGRMGMWQGGKTPPHRGDVVLMIGANPLVSILPAGADPRNPAKRLKEMKARGTKLIVIDPRRTETARSADLLLQPLPGHDASIFAALLHIVLKEQWHDREFCARNVADLEKLKEAVAPFTPEAVAEVAGVTPEELVAVADLFARQCKTGAAWSGTGPDMGPHSNLAEHLIEALNVVCGRFLREGERIDNPGTITPRYPRKAAVMPAPRWWDQGYKSRIGAFGLIAGEVPAGILADEILEPGPGQVRALLCHGGNPASALPGQRRAVEALRSLDLLVSIEPVMTTTAQLSDYILPPKLQYERADLPLYLYETSVYPTESFARYTPAVAKPPAGSDVADDAYIFWALAKRLGVQMKYLGRDLDMTAPPAIDDLLAMTCEGGVVSLEELKRHPRGDAFGEPQYVEPAEGSDTGKFTLAPNDVLDEVRQLIATNERDAADRKFDCRLAVRRLRHVNNSMYRDLPKLRKLVPANLAYMNGSTLAAHGLAEGEKVRIVSQFGAIVARAAMDNDLRPNVVSVPHGFGGLPDDTDYEEDGVSINLLLPGVELRETINAMPQMTGLPVRLEKA